MSNSFSLAGACLRDPDGFFPASENRLLMWFGASEVTFVYADTYMTIYTIGTFFALMALGLNYFITCQGFSTVGMATVLTGAVTNIVLDPIFIFVLDMGWRELPLPQSLPRCCRACSLWDFCSANRCPLVSALGIIPGRSWCGFCPWAFRPF